jgi:ribosomal protein L11 methyltransferase
LADVVPRSWPALDIDLRPGTPPSDEFDDRLAILLDDLAATAVDVASGVHWRVFFSHAASRDAALETLRGAVGGCADVSSVDVPDDGWAVRAQEALAAVRVGRIVVAPPWDRTASAGDGDSVAIVIEPSMGFGTGHHQSTRLCLRVLQRLALDGAYVTDVGTGSGVLAIAAARLGAARVVALDSDPDAVQAARENTTRNGAGVDVRLADVASSDVAPADVVLANLTAFDLGRFRTQLARLVAPGGALVASGFTSDQAPLVVESFAEFSVAERVEEDDWVALVFRPPGTSR